MSTDKPVIKKKVHLEIIRVIAIFLVIYQHTNTNGTTYYLKCNNSIEYMISLFLSFASKIAVPLFFMISGALLLKKEEPIKIVLKKRILRMVIVLIAVSFLYCDYFNRVNDSFNLFTIFNSIKLIYAGKISIPLWYLYSYIAALFMLPFLRILTNSMKTKHYIYLLVINVALVTVVPIISEYLLHTKLSTDFSIPLAVERNTFFMLMGYFVENIIPKEKFTAKNSLLLSAGGLLFIIICMILTDNILKNNPTSESAYLLFYNKFVSIPAISFYFSIKYITMIKPLNDKAQRIFCFLGANVFGTYLLEAFLRKELLFIFDYLKPIITTLPACFVWVTCCVISGIIITAILRLIPFMKKLI